MLACALLMPCGGGGLHALAGEGPSGLTQLRPPRRVFSEPVPPLPAMIQVGFEATAAGSGSRVPAGQLAWLYGETSTIPGSSLSMAWYPGHAFSPLHQ